MTEGGSKPAFDPRLGYDVRPDLVLLQGQVYGPRTGWSIEPRMSPLDPE